MSELLDINKLQLGDIIAFKSLNPYDAVKWRGKITGFGDYNLVKYMEDLVPYYQQVKKHVATIPNLENLSFIIVDCYENLTTEVSTRRIFAKEWIDASSLTLIDLNRHMDIRIFDVGETDINRIKDLLSDHNFSMSVISISTNE